VRPWVLPPRTVLKKKNEKKKKVVIEIESVGRWEHSHDVGGTEVDIGLGVPSHGGAFSGLTFAHVWADTCPLSPCACRQPWCRKYTRIFQPGVPRWFASTQDSVTWSWSGRWGQFLRCEWHGLGLEWQSKGRVEFSDAHDLVIPLNTVTIGGRRSSAALTHL
jgi:hypothetical protein